MTEPPAHRRAEQPPVPALRTTTPAAPEPAAEPGSGGEAEKHGRKAFQPKEA